MRPVEPSMDAQVWIREVDALRALARALLADEHAAEDLVQETWLRTRERSPGAIRRPRRWLSAVLRNLVRDRQRTETHRRERERVAARDEGLPSPERIVERLELVQRVAHEAAGLREPYRTAIHLHYFEGLTVEEIAARAGLPKETVRTQVRRGLAELRVQLDGVFGGDREAWSLALVPLALRIGSQAGGSGAAGASLATIGGALAMTKIQLGVAAAGVVAAAAMLFWLVRDAAGPHPTYVAAASGESGAVEAPDDAGEQEAGVVGTGIEPVRDARRPVADETSGATLLALRDPDGAPASWARVAVFEDGTVLWTGQANENGGIALDSSAAGEATLLVLASGCAPQVHNLALEPGRQEVQLRAGAVLSGRLLLDGNPLEEALPLELDSDHPLLPIEEVGTSWEALGLDPRWAAKVGGRSSPRGTFRFFGLPDTWSGCLTLPRYLVPEDRSLCGPVPSSVVLRRPIEELSIELVRLVRLKGRVVATPGGEPVPGAVLRPALVYPAEVPGQGYQGYELADAEGRFEVILLAQELRGGSLQIASADELVTREIPIEPDELTEDKDLGELALVDTDTTISVQLEVVDSAGHPVPGAVAGTTDKAPASMRTDEEGRTVLRGLLPGVSLVHVHALGYEAAEVRLPLEPPEVLFVTMQRSTLLELLVRTPDGSGATVRLILEASEPPMGENRPLPPVRARMSAGEDPFIWYPVRDGYAIASSTDRDGRLILNAIRPGLALRLRVDDLKGGEILDRRPLAPLQVGEHRTTEIVLARGPKRLEGQVLDEWGEPIAHASISWYRRDRNRIGVSRASSIQTNAEGQFSLKQVYSETIDLAIRKVGFVPFHEPRMRIPDTGEVIEFRLSSGRDVRVTIEDGGGNRLDGQVWFDLAEGVLEIGRQVEPGVYMLRGLPDEPVTVTARVHQVLYPVRHAPGDPEILIQVPPLGAVAATISLLQTDPVDETERILVLVAEAGSGLTERRKLILFDSGDWPLSCVIEGVLPGRYLASVKRVLDPHITDPPLVEVTLPQPIEVRAGETTPVHILP